jgi:hypothetical protein
MGADERGVLIVYVPKFGVRDFGRAHIGGADLLPLCGAVLGDDYTPRRSGTVFGWERYLCATCRALAERARPELKRLFDEDS